MRTACYLRFSSSKQKLASIQDQLRNVENYCDRMKLPRPIIFKDEAISGSRNDRPGYMEMLAAAEAGLFDILLVDDLGRMTRDNIETLTATRQLKFLGIQVIGVSDGVDTSREGHKIEVGLRGLMNESYVDELSKKTHRGLMGRALKGFATGGPLYGYSSVKVEGEGFKRIINEEEAQWVRYIFERFSQGIHSRRIAIELNEKGVKGPRGGTWTGSAIHPTKKLVGILANEMYNGKKIWNRSVWKKNPMNDNKKVRFMRPREEWMTIEIPELQIIDNELWERCQARIKAQQELTAAKKIHGKKAYGLPSKYLFSELLKCGVCGSNYIVVNRTSYGCSQHKNHGAPICSNGLRIKRVTIEQDLLRGIKTELLSEEAYRDFERNLRASIKAGSTDSTPLKKKVAEIQKGVDNLIKAITNGIDSPSVKAALRDHEQQLQDAQNKLKAFERIQPTQLVPRAREMYEDLVASLETIEDVAAARQSLKQLIGEVILKPENGSLTAEVSNRLSLALQIVEVSGTQFEHYLPPVRRFSGLK
jgi:site-specific DNA recombinase